MKYWLLGNRYKNCDGINIKNNNDVFVIVVIIIVFITWNIIGIAHNTALTGQKLSFALIQHLTHVLS
jgi:hypothetical protein